MRPLRGSLAALTLLAVALLGPKCGPPAVAVSLSFDPPSVTIPALTWVELDVVAEVQTGSLQAFEIAVEGTEGKVYLFEAFPSDFDDDGGFFLPPVPVLGGGRLERIVDVRHGAGNAATGTVRLARLRIFALEAGTADLTVSASLMADPAGATLVTSGTGGSIEIQP